MKLWCARVGFALIGLCAAALLIDQYGLRWGLGLTISFAASWIVMAAIIVGAEAERYGR